MTKMRKNVARMGQEDICPDCGGKLEELKEEKKIKENVNKFIRFK
jgi:transcription initiation factor IIE alpha subunit